MHAPGEFVVRILHISDLHVQMALEGMPDWRHNKVRADAAPRRRVFQALLEVLRAQCKTLTPFDIVAFTGDVADWGLPEEYTKATEYVDNILDAAGVTREQFFVVPGNHDVRRDRGRAEWEQVREFAARYPNELSGWMRGLKPPLNVDATWKATISQRTEAFWAWVTRGLGREQIDPRRGPHGYLGYRVTIERPGLPFPVHVVGFDSAWLAGDEHDTGKLLLSRHQVDALTTNEQGAELQGFCLALVHHPLTDLADGKTCGKLLGRNVHLLLHGHQHELTAERHEDPDGISDVLAAGSIFDTDQGDRWPNSFHVLEAHLDENGRPLRYEIDIWAWSARGLHWHKTDSIYRATRNGHLTWWTPHGRTQSQPLSAPSPEPIAQQTPSIVLRTASSPTPEPLSAPSPEPIAQQTPSIVLRTASSPPLEPMGPSSGGSSSPPTTLSVISPLKSARPSKVTYKWGQARWVYAVVIIATAIAVAGGAAWGVALWNQPQHREKHPVFGEHTALAAVAPMRFIPLPGGRFQMGSPPSERHRGSDETPHWAEVGWFEIAVHEVTQKQWVNVMGPKAFDCEFGCNDDIPAQNVTWYEALKFMNALTERDNKEHPEREERTRCYDEETWSWDRTCTGYRLPTEAEWEYAARAAKTTAYSFGNDPKELCAYGNGSDQSANRVRASWPAGDCDDGAPGLLAVGRKVANEWNLYDMHGNVSEWVWDWYGTYPNQSTVGYAGPDKGEWRVVRGGAFWNDVGKLRSAHRFKLQPSLFPGVGVGFRCARGASPAP